MQYFEESEEASTNPSERPSNGWKRISPKSPFDSPNPVRGKSPKSIPNSPPQDDKNLTDKIKDLLPDELPTTPKGMWIEDRIISQRDCVETILRKYQFASETITRVDEGCLREKEDERNNPWGYDEDGIPDLPDDTIVNAGVYAASIISDWSDAATGASLHHVYSGGVSGDLWSQSEIFECDLEIFGVPRSEIGRGYFRAGNTCSGKVWSHPWNYLNKDFDRHRSKGLHDFLISRTYAGHLSVGVYDEPPFADYALAPSLCGPQVNGEMKTPYDEPIYLDHRPYVYMFSGTTIRHIRRVMASPNLFPKSITTSNGIRQTIFYSVVIKILPLGPIIPPASASPPVSYPDHQPPMNCPCLKLEDVQRILAVNFKKYVGNIPESPTEVPKSLRWEKGKKPPDIKLMNLQQVLEYQIKAFDEILGHWDLPVEIEDTDPNKKGNQKEIVYAPNLAEAIGELYGILIKINNSSDINTKIGIRTLTQVANNAQVILKIYHYCKTILESLNIGFKNKTEKLKIACNLNGDDIEEIAEPSEIKVQVVSPKFDWNIKAAFHDLLHAAAIIRAIHWRQIDPNKDIASQLDSRIRNQENTEGDEEKEDFDTWGNRVQRGFAEENVSSKSGFKGFKPRIRKVKEE